MKLATYDGRRMVVFKVQVAVYVDPEPAIPTVEVQVVGPPVGVDVRVHVGVPVGPGAVAGTVIVAVKVIEFVAGVVI